MGSKFWNKVYRIGISAVMSTVVGTAASLMLVFVPGTVYENEVWMSIAVTGICTSLLQLTCNVPYGLIKNRKKAKYCKYAWWGVHTFSSMICAILFFLAFFVGGSQSDELRASFWTQFKLHVEPSETAAQFTAALLVFTDFVGLNCALSLIIVVYPKLAKAWNREDAEEANQPVSLKMTSR